MEMVIGFFIVVGLLETVFPCKEIHIYNDGEVKSICINPEELRDSDGFLDLEKLKELGVI